MFFLHHYRHNFGWHHHKYLGGLRQAQESERPENSP